MFNKAYMIKAFYQWANDCNYIPEMEMYIDESYQGKRSFPDSAITDRGTVILNISKAAARRLEITNDRMNLAVSFGSYGMMEFSIGIDSIKWVGIREIGEYLYLDHERKSVKFFVQNEIEESKIAAEEEKMQKRIAQRGVPPEEIQNWITEKVQHYIDLLHVRDWVIKFKVIEQDHQDSVENKKRAEGNCFITTADCKMNYQYKNAVIRIFATEVSNIEQLERIIVHELAHVATACFGLYARYFEKSALYLTSQKEIAEKIEKDIYELLAIQIEAIVLGKESNRVGTYNSLTEAEKKFLRSCYETNIIDEKRVLLHGHRLPVTPFEIVEEAKKYDPYYWYGKYKEASELSKKKYDNETSEHQKKIINDQFILERKIKNKELILPMKCNENKNDEFFYTKIVVPNFVGNNKK